MSGIDCFEKIANSELNDENGHTWNCANIDGNWYNFEATTSETSLANVTGIGGGCYFAFADDLLDQSAEFEAEMPIIEKGYYINSSGHFSSEADDSLLDSMITAFKSSGNKYAVFTFDSFNYDKCENTLQTMVDRLNISVRTVTFEGKNRTILYLEIA